MSVNLQQNSDGSMGLQGVDFGSGAFVSTSFAYSATSVDAPFFIAPRSLRVKAVTLRVEVAGTDAGAVSAIVRKAASGTAIAAGVALHSGSADLKGTAATNQVLALSATDADQTVPAGTCVGVDFTGVLTTAAGVVTVTFCPL